MADELEEGLKELGNRLTSPPSDVDDLISLLDQTKNLLARVEQSPPESLLTALRPAMLALVAKELLEHSHVDVKVSVASCLSEITKITVPDPPYPYDLMKGIFIAIIDAFGALDDMSNCSFSKRVSILESVANVRSCVVMLDMECDDLILQMFQHFLKTIRLNHPENVFSLMKTIMIDVIEESDNISESLLLCLLSPLNKENKDVLPIAWKLAEEVVNKCKVKLKSSLDDIKSLSAPLIEHSKVLASICQLNSDATEQGQQNAFGGCWESEDLVLKIGCCQELGTTADESSKCVMGKGTYTVGIDNTVSEPISGNANTDDYRSGQSETCLHTIVVPSNGDCPLADKSDDMPYQDAKKRRDRQHGSLTWTLATKDPPIICIDEESPPVSSNIHAVSVLLNDQCAMSLEDGKTGTVALPIVTMNMPDTVHSKVGVDQHSGAKLTPESDIDGKAMTVYTPLGNSVKNSESDEKLQRQTTTGIATEIESSGKPQDSKFEQQKRMIYVGGHETEELNAKDVVASPKSLKALHEDQHHIGDKLKLKRKHAQPQATKMISEAEKEKGHLNQNLIGSKIKVWWPDDECFYEGVVDSFDPVSKMHKIVYRDGDVETLLLEKEHWEPVNNDREIDERQAELPGHDAASKLIHLAKSKKMVEDEDWKRLNETVPFIPSKKIRSAPNLRKGRSKEPSKKKIKCVETMQQISVVSGQIEETPLPNASLSLEDGGAKVSSSRSQKKEENQINGISSLENIVEKKKSLSASPCQLHFSVPPVARKISTMPTPPTSRGALLLQKFIRPVSSPLSALPSHNRANSGPSKVELYNTQALAEVKKLFAHFQNGDFSGSEISYDLRNIEVSEPARTIFPKFFEIYPQSPTFDLEPRASHEQKIEMWVSVVGLFNQVCQDAQNNVLSSSYVELEKEIQGLVDMGFNLQPLQYVIELIKNSQKRADHFVRRMNYIGKLISAEEARVKELFPLENKQKELGHSLLEATEGLKADEEKLEVLKVLIVELNDKIAKRKGEIEIIKKELQNVDELRRGNMLHSGDLVDLKQLKEEYRSMENELAVFGNFLEDTGILKLKTVRSPRTTEMGSISEARQVNREAPSKTVGALATQSRARSTFGDGTRGVSTNTKIKSGYRKDDTPKSKGTQTEGGKFDTSSRSMDDPSRTKNKKDISRTCKNSSDVILDALEADGDALETDGGYEEASLQGRTPEECTGPKTGVGSSRNVSSKRKAKVQRVDSSIANVKLELTKTNNKRRPRRKS